MYQTSEFVNQVIYMDGVDPAAAEKVPVEHLLEMMPSGDVIKALVERATPRHNEMRTLHGRYMSEKKTVPIFEREYMIDNVPVKGKVNNRLHSDFFKLIINSKVGILTGNSIDFQIKPDVYGGSESEKYAALKKVVDRILAENDIQKQEMETAKLCACCGEAYRLLFVDPATVQLYMRYYFPWNVIPVFTESICYPEAAIILERDTTGEIVFADLYTANFRFSYTVDKEGEFQPVGARVHYFGHCPVVGWQNNEERQGDNENTLSLQDAYDRRFSDLDSEMEQFRLAILALTGATFPDDAASQLQVRGLVEIPEKDAKLAYLTKVLDIEPIDSELNRLEDNITMFSQTTNYLDRNFASAAAGVSIKLKQSNEKQKCKVYVQEALASTRQMFRLIASYLKVERNIDLDPLDVTPSYTLDFPVSLLEEADVQDRLDDKIPVEERLKLFSPIRDAAAAAKQLLIERAERMGL